MAKGKIWKVASLIGVAGLLVGGVAMGFIGDNKEQKQIDDLNAQLIDAQNQPALEVVVTEEVLVDNGNLGLVLEYIDENIYKDKVDFSTLDLGDDEIELLVDRIVFTNEIKAKAIAEVKAKAFSELNHEYVNTTKLHVEDLERLKVQDDYSDVIVSDLDFEDGDANVFVTVKFEQDDIKYEADFNVEFEDGEIEDLNLLEAKLRI